MLPFPQALDPHAGTFLPSAFWVPRTVLSPWGPGESSHARHRKDFRDVSATMKVKNKTNQPTQTRLIRRMDPG